MTGWIRRAGGVAAAGIGMLIVGVLALGIAANTAAGVVSFWASLPQQVLVALWIIGPVVAIVAVLAWTRRGR